MCERRTKRCQLRSRKRFFTPIPRRIRRYERCETEEEGRGDAGGEQGGAELNSGRSCEKL